MGIISLVLALSLPTKHIDWSGWVYFSTFILVPLDKAYARRKKE